MKSDRRSACERVTRGLSITHRLINTLGAGELELADLVRPDVLAETDSEIYKLWGAVSESRQGVITAAEQVEWSTSPNVCFHQLPLFSDIPVN